LAGRLPKLAHQQHRERGYETLAETARSYNVSPATISRLET
jgi:hypothetical protein